MITAMDPLETRSPIQFVTLASALACIAGLAVAFTALRAATDFWLGVVAGLTGLALLLACVRAASGRGRAFSVGFVFVAGAYLALAFAPWCRSRVGMPTEALIQRVHSSLGLSPRFRVERYDRDGRTVSSTVVDAGAESERMASAILLGGAGSTIVFGTQSPGSWVPTSPGPAWVNAMQTRDDLLVFVRIGHLLTAWILGFVGALVGVALGKLLQRRRRRDTARTNAHARIENG